MLSNQLGSKFITTVLTYLKIMKLFIMLVSIINVVGTLTCNAFFDIATAVT